MKFLFVLLSIFMFGTANAGCSDPELDVSNALLEELVKTSTQCVEDYECEAVLKTMINNPEGILNTSGCYLLQEGSVHLHKHNCMVRKLMYNYKQMRHIFIILGD